MPGLFLMHKQVLTAASEQMAGSFLHLWHRGTSNIKDLQIENLQGREWRSKLLWWEGQGITVLETGF